jgi:GGDEF domain-containing protein
MCIPLVSFGQSLGVLMLDSSASGAFQPSDRQPLESVADICATAIQNAHYVERVKQLAYIDGLTGIFNRRFFELRINEEMERALRFDVGMSVIMIDIDQFKRLNDEFGHLLGDEVLRQVSSLFHQQLRKIDVVCRLRRRRIHNSAVPDRSALQLGRAEITPRRRNLAVSWVPRPVTISAGVATFLNTACRVTI